MNHRYAGLTGLVCLIWGVASGWWPLGLTMALLLESPLLIRRRLPLDDPQIVMLSKLSLLVTCLLFPVFLIDEPRNGLINFVTWMPFTLLPVVLVQVWHPREKYPLRAVAASLVKSEQLDGEHYPEQADVRILYCFLVLVSVALNLPAGLFWFPLFALVMVWMLWRAGGDRARPGRRLLMLGLSLGLALVMVSGIEMMHRSIRAHSAAWVAEYWARMNLHQSHTAIGNIGQLKLSARITMRIKARPGQRQLLRQGSYSSYHDGTWSVADMAFLPIPYDQQAAHWPITKGRPTTDPEHMTVSARLIKGRGLVVQPPGSYALTVDGEADVEANASGAVRLQVDDDQVDYRVSYDNSATIPGEPTYLDLTLPEQERAMIEQVADELGLDGSRPEQVVTRLRDFFAGNFLYSLEQRVPPPGHSFLENFLRHRRQGHCEYFATSTALLLRAAGIPSRYVIGYAMEEYDDSIERYLIRERHGHAWTLAWIDGAWRTLDFTPPDWLAQDAGHDSPRQWLYDRVSNLQYQLLQWWRSEDKGLAFNLGALSASLLLIAWLLRRMQAQQSNRQNGAGPHTSGYSERGIELGIEQLLDWLQTHAGTRPEGEPLRKWIARVLPEVMAEGPADETLDQLTAEYYRLRFGDDHDPGRQTTMQRRLRRWIEARR